MDLTSSQGSEGGVCSFCFCCSMAACAAAESCLSTQVFTFSPDSRFWENATLVSNKSANVDATKVLMWVPSGHAGDDNLSRNRSGSRYLEIGETRLALASAAFTEAAKLRADRRSRRTRSAVRRAFCREPGCTLPGWADSPGPCRQRGMAPASLQRRDDGIGRDGRCGACWWKQPHSIQERRSNR
jgi:hypothetical protein